MLAQQHSQESAVAEAIPKVADKYEQRMQKLAAKYARKLRNAVRASNIVISLRTRDHDSHLRPQNRLNRAFFDRRDAHVSLQIFLVNDGPAPRHEGLTCIMRLRLDRPIMRGMLDDKTGAGFADPEELEAAKRRFGWRGIDDFPKRENKPASYRVFHSVGERGSSTTPTAHNTMPWTQRWELRHEQRMPEITIDLGDIDYRFPHAS